MARKKAKAIVWKAILDDPVQPIRVIVPASSRSEAMQYLHGLGEVLYLKPCPDVWIDGQKLSNALLISGFGEDEVDVIVRSLTQFLDSHYFRLPF